MAPGLRNHPTGQRKIRGAHVVGVIGVVLRMAHHELWLHRTNDIHHLILRLLAQVQWIIPKVQNLMSCTFNAWAAFSASLRRMDFT